MVLHLCFQICKEELVFCLLQPPPTGGRLEVEGFAGSHGCISFPGLGFVVHLKTQIHPSLLFTQSFLRHRSRVTILSRLLSSARSGMMSGVPVRKRYGLRSERR